MPYDPPLITFMAIVAIEEGLDAIVSVELVIPDQPTVRRNLTTTKISNDLAASELTNLIRSGLRLCFYRDHRLKLQGTTVMIAFS